MWNVPGLQQGCLKTPLLIYSVFLKVGTNYCSKCSQILRSDPPNVFNKNCGNIYAHLTCTTERDGLKFEILELFCKTFSTFKSFWLSNSCPLLDTAEFKMETKVSYRYWNCWRIAIFYLVIMFFYMFAHSSIMFIWEVWPPLCTNRQISNISIGVDTVGIG